MRSRGQPPAGRLGLGGLVVLLAILLAAQDMPDDHSVHGINRLARKAGWSVAWASFTLPPPLPYPGALIVLVLDPAAESDLGGRAALYLAEHGDPRMRLQAASTLVAACDPRGFPLLRQAIRIALAASPDCDLLHRAIRAARSAPRSWHPILAREFTRESVVRRWGTAAVEAGRKIANASELGRRVARAGAGRPRAGDATGQRRSCVAQPARSP